MFWYSTYGFLVKEIEPLAHELERLMQVQWQMRESDFWGQYYLYPPFHANPDRVTRETYKLYLNHVELEGWNKQHFKNCRVLLDTTTERPLEIDQFLFSAFKNKVILLDRAPKNSTVPPTTPE